MALEILRDINQLWPELGKALTSLADGVDLLLTDASQQGPGANIAEYYDIPLAAVHIYPIMQGATDSHITKEAEDAYRRALGLPEERCASTRPPLEIQAFDELFFPGLAAEWEKWYVRRPFVGGLTLELPADADDEVASWIAAGEAPIHFGFGSSARVAFPADLVEMIAAACAQLGERALICSGSSDLTNIPHFDRVKVVGTINHSAVFPACRAVVYHGAPAPLSQAGGLKFLRWPFQSRSISPCGQVGIGRPFFDTLNSLVADLRSILTPHCVTRTREVAAQMATPAESAATAADLLEDAVRLGPSTDRQTRAAE